MRTWTLSALARLREPRPESTRATSAARERDWPRASVSRTAQNSGSSATLVRCPEIENERFLSTAATALLTSLGLVRPNHRLRANQRLELGGRNQSRFQ